MTSAGATVAVAIHDVEPATYPACVRIREWLGQLGIDRATLLVIPAPDLHPFDERRPELAHWLRQQARAGDAIAQHGLQHRQSRRAAPPRQWLARRQGAGAAEFVGLSADETRRAVRSGRRLLKLAGIDARGFVAPAYAYTPALRLELAATFDWWAGLLRVHWGQAASSLSPAVCLGSSSRAKRALSPGMAGAGAACGGRLLRVDVHPADLESPRARKALERIVQRAVGARRAVSYDDLVGRPPPPVRIPEALEDARARSARAA